MIIKKNNKKIKPNDKITIYKNNNKIQINYTQQQPKTFPIKKINNNYYENKNKKIKIKNKKMKFKTKIKEN